MHGWAQLLGAPWRAVTCIGLINVLARLPNLDGTKWGRVKHLTPVPWHRREDGDIVLWHYYQPDGYWKIGHAGVLVNATEQFLLHSGYKGPPPPNWRDEATVQLIQLEHPTGAIFR